MRYILRDDVKIIEFFLSSVNTQQLLKVAGDYVQKYLKFFLEICKRKNVKIQFFDHLKKAQWKI